MGLLEEFTDEQAYLKAGFLGFAGTGKTFTAADLAVGVRAHFKLEGPIAFFDTETGSSYVGNRLFERTGVKPLRRVSRSLDDLLEVTRECLTRKVSVLLVDSVTHVWRHVCEVALAEINEARRRHAEDNNYLHKFRPLTKLEFQHWGPVKDKWNQFTDLYLNSPMHIIICGRAGFEYDFEENENGRKELIKTGIKMKTEGEFGFEPSLLIEMVRDWVNGEQVRRAIILKDRFDVIDGKVFNNPTFDSFLPHIARLTPGSHSGIDMGAKTKIGLDGDGDNDWRREKQRRTILCEEIQGLMTAKWPGRTKEETQAKTDVLQKFFGTRSWTKVEAMPAAKLEPALKKMREEIEPAGGAQPAAPAEMSEEAWEAEQARRADEALAGKPQPN